MGYSITDFYQTATQYGLARDNLFRIDSIDGVYSGDQQSNTNLMLFMRSAEVPQRLITDSPVKFRGFTYTVPMKSQYQSGESGWTCQFLCDNQYTLRDIFESWSVETFDEHSVTTGNQNQWFQTNVNIVLLDNSDLTPVRSYTLVGAFPNTIGPIAYNLTSKGDLAMQSITLKYQYFVATNLTT